ncbi:riboflavin synthase, alpha subunit [Gloeothece citriformis PCC 7424]|uniref:Riboflavin synthase n=1 Tax=Gloeothece citriformis (strain PCC 7424) TaxID=65393 RepID=B7KAN9_GLOC7|nr:riboflavin synthase [Gloeothece citriformis]ACK68711.1 riboflavin synthase, alpha subunit [Gloeothece citriformis PCC 7424]
MFTGLIQGLGTIKSLSQDRFTLSVLPSATDSILSDLVIGDSVAVDGVCLTVEEILLDGFIATASPETLQRTTLGRRERAAEYINLETSLRVGSKLGGHFVTGHVDGLGCLEKAISTEKSWEMRFIAPSSLSEQWQNYIAGYLVQKGSIAVNGISLTIAECDSGGNWFKVSVIPHTYSETNLCYLQPGDWVNLECDILGKYVNKLLTHSSKNIRNPEEISLSFLAEHGYLS